MVQLRSRMVSYQGLREGEAGVVFNGCSFSYAGRVSSSELLYNTVPTVNTVWYTYTFAKKADFMLNALTLIKKKNGIGSIKNLDPQIRSQLRDILL